jgi:hypothetical protein
MEPRTRGDIHIDVGMVHTMQAPEDRHRVKQHVLQVDGEIQQKDRDSDRQERWQRPYSMEQSPTPLLRNYGHTHRRHREYRADEDSVESYQGDVRGPSPAPAHRSMAPGYQSLSSRQENGDHDERPQPYRRFVTQGIHRSKRSGSLA